MPLTAQQKKVLLTLYTLLTHTHSSHSLRTFTPHTHTHTHTQLLFDGHLSSVVCFSYNAKAVDGQLCLEASPNENPSLFTHSPHATLLEGVEPVVTTPFHTVLHSLGGVQVHIPHTLLTLTHSCRLCFLCSLNWTILKAPPPLWTTL